ncbi:VWFA domain-containing protein [Pseudoscourfieldia marina]
MADLNGGVGAACSSAPPTYDDQDDEDAAAAALLSPFDPLSYCDGAGGVLSRKLSVGYCPPASDNVLLEVQNRVEGGSAARGDDGRSTTSRRRQSIIRWRLLKRKCLGNLTARFISRVICAVCGVALLVVGGLGMSANLPNHDITWRSLITVGWLLVGYDFLRIIFVVLKGPAIALYAATMASTENDDDDDDDATKSAATFGGTAAAAYFVARMQPSIVLLWVLIGEAIIWSELWCCGRSTMARARSKARRCGAKASVCKCRVSGCQTFWWARRVPPGWP